LFSESTTLVYTVAHHPYIDVKSVKCNNSIKYCVCLYIMICARSYDLFS